MDRVSENNRRCERHAFTAGLMWETEFLVANFRNNYKKYNLEYHTIERKHNQKVSPSLKARELSFL